MIAASDSVSSILVSSSIFAVLNSCFIPRRSCKSAMIPRAAARAQSRAGTTGVGSSLFQNVSGASKGNSLP